MRQVDFGLGDYVHIRGTRTWGVLIDGGRNVPMDFLMRSDQGDEFDITCGEIERA